VISSLPIAAVSSIAGLSAAAWPLLLAEAAEEVVLGNAYADA
jgi:hypothetical protein